MLNIECRIENKFDIDDIKKNAKALMANITMCSRDDFNLFSIFVFSIFGFMLYEMLYKGDLNDRFLTGLFSELIIIIGLFCSVWATLDEKRFSNALRRTLEVDLEKACTLDEVLTVTRTLQKNFISYKNNTKLEHDIFDLSMLNERLETYLILVNNMVLHTDLIGNTLHFDVKGEDNVVNKKEIRVNLVEKVGTTGYTLLFENWKTPTLVCKY